MSLKNRQFPGLLPDDIELWERFLSAFPDRFERFDYDVRVGTGRDPGERFVENVRKMAVHLSQRRIDAVGFNDGELTIIEITLSAGLRALGQLQVYPGLYRSTFLPLQRIKTMLVAESVQADIMPTLQTSNIELILLPK